MEILKELLYLIIILMTVILAFYLFEYNANIFEYFITALVFRLYIGQGLIMKELY